MEIVADVLAVLLAAVMAGSAFAKLTKAKPVVENLDKADVPHSMHPMLATIQIVGAVGLIVGLWMAWAGITAGFGFTAYFALACGFHVRAGDAKGIGVPATLGIVALVEAVLRLSS